MKITINNLTDDHASIYIRGRGYDIMFPIYLQLDVSDQEITTSDPHHISKVMCDDVISALISNLAAPKLVELMIHPDIASKFGTYHKNAPAKLKLVDGLMEIQ